MVAQCSNCETRQGPFKKWGANNTLVCIDTKLNPTRVHDCVERRAKLDAKRYPQPTLRDDYLLEG